MPISRNRNSRRKHRPSKEVCCCDCDKNADKPNGGEIVLEGRQTIRKERTRLWEFPVHFHCSIIGTCLDLDELRYLARKTTLPNKDQLTDYDLHRAFVGMVQEPGSVAKLVQKHLDRKYKRFVRQFADVHGEGAMAACWGEAVASGKVAGPYWALLTHPELSDALLDKVYGEIHMMSHLAGASCRADMQELTALRARARQLEKQIVEDRAMAHRKAVEYNETIRKLQASSDRLARMEKELRETKARLEAFEKNRVFDQLQIQLENHADLLADAQMRAERAEASVEKWERLARESSERHLKGQVRVADLQSERDALETALERLLASDCDACENRDSCDRHTDLGGRRVLYVGGIERQCTHFRALVERQNGEFIHHDGGVDDGRQRLGSILPRADVVVCPLDCVSHDAVRRVKHFCKYNDKHLVFLPRASLAAFTRGLNELALAA
uniref:DUF2325 domain-containing protein n=1 Tax=Candidatus Kentrum sp. FW TaxID=2126338 RepID=A0A450TYU1_9GAMM|nr:MAG: hypothetical protein (DUF2325) [Candidatus Kentron sp. FW]